MPHEEAAMTYVCMNDFRDAADLTLVIREESVTDVSARERLLDRAHAVRPFRMARRGDVVDTGGVRDQECGHRLHLIA